MVDQTLPTLYPWQTSERDTMLAAHHQDRMPHALLVSGIEGLGLAQFATFLSACLLCENLQAASKFCGRCRSCRLIKAGSHPDLRLFNTEENTAKINVSDIRELIVFMHLKSQYGRYKIALITPADTINRSAANALLKTLEEPPPRSLLILATHYPHRLPITIRSRCQCVKFHPAYDEATVRWVKSCIKDGDAKALLALACGAPLRVRALLEDDSFNRHRSILDDLSALRDSRCDVVEVAARWRDYDGVHVLAYLLRLCTDMMRIKISAKALYNDSATLLCLHQWVKELELRELASFYQVLFECYTLASGTVAYRMEGLLEDSIIAWQRLR